MGVFFTSLRATNGSAEIYIDAWIASSPFASLRAPHNDGGAEK